MSAVAIDFETCLIQPGLLAPPPVCLSVCEAGRSPELIGSDADGQHMRSKLAQLFRARRIVGFNVPFDAAVVLQWFPELIGEVFAAFDEGRVFDASIAERLHEIATGRPAQYGSLAVLAARYGVAELDKEGSPRLDYARFLGRPLNEYTEEHKIYSLRDADVHMRLWLRIHERCRGKVTDEAIAQETRHAMWLHLCAARGIRTNADNIEELRRNAVEAVTELRARVESYGFVRGDGSKDTKVIKERVKLAYGKAPPLAKTGQALVKAGKPWELKHIAINKVALADSGDPVLEDFARYGEWSAVLNKDLGMLLGGVEHPIHTRYAMADTTRTTSAGPNMQNFRRLPGVRECVVPRSGHCFGAIDVGGLELGTLAQVIAWKLGVKHMAELINKGTDLHLFAACRLRGWDYETAKKRLKAGDPEVKEWRQFCKIANFGYPGFMGAATLVPYARQQGVRITLGQAQDLKRNWQRTLPEASAYLRWIKTRANPRSGRYDFVIPGSPGILRAGATISSCANGHFQGLGAQVMKRAGWDLMKEIWVDRSSALYNQHIVMFIHDEFIFEIPIGAQHEVMNRAKQVLETRLAKDLPDVRLHADPVAMALWSKDAKTVTNEQGELGIWQPKAA